MSKNIVLYTIAFILLGAVIILFNKAYKNQIAFSESTNRHNAVRNSYQNLSIHVNNAAIISQDLVRANLSFSAGKIFYTDSLSVIHQLEQLQSIVRDPVNINLAARLDSIVRSELSWLLRSDVLDSVINNNSPAHVASFRNIDSLISGGIDRTSFLINYLEGAWEKESGKLRWWMNLLIILSGTLLIYTTVNLFRQQSLRKTKELEVVTVLNRISDSVVSVDNEWRYTFLNDTALATHPLGKARTLGKVIWDVHPEMKGTIFWDKYHEAMETKKVIDLESLYAPMGIWFSVKIYPSADGLTIFYKDITEVKKVQLEQLHTLKELTDYKYALDESSIIAITDQKGIIKHANENFCKISKYPCDELIGQDHRIINSGYHSKEYIRNLWVTIASGRIWKGDLKNKAKDGTAYWVDTTIIPFLDEHKKPYQYVAIRSDITERKRAEEEIQQLNASLDQKVLLRTNELLQANNKLSEALERTSFLASIADNIQDPVISTDKDSIITRWNKPAAQLLEWESDEVIGKSAIDILKVIYPNEAREQIIESFNKKGFWQGEAIYHSRSGKSLNVLLTASHLRDAGGNITGNLILARDITQRKEAEMALHTLNNELEERVFQRTQELHKSEKQYRYIFENNPLPMFIMEIVTYKFLDVNEMAIAHYGYSRKEFLSMTAIDIRPEQDIEHFKQFDFSFEPASANYNKGVWNHRKKDGTVIKAEIIAHDIMFEGVQARIILANDVTKQKEAEEKLAASEKRFRLLVENNYDIISMIDESFKTIYRSPSATRIMGWAKDEMKEMEDFNNVHPEDREIMTAIIKKSQANPGKKVNALFRRKHKDGHYVWLEGTITNLLHDDQVKSFITNFRDVTNQKKAEKELVAREKRFRALIENNYDMISLMDDSFKVIYRSPSAKRITGWSDEEMKNIDGTKNIHPDDLGKARQIVQEVLAHPGTAVNTSFRNKHKDGHYLWIEGTVINLLQDENVKAIVFNFRNITDRVEAEEKLIESESLYRNLFTNMLHGFAYCKAIFENDSLTDFTYIAVNREHEKLTGLKDIAGKKMSEVVPDLLRSDPTYAGILNNVVLYGRSEKFESYVKPLDMWYSISIYSPGKGYFVTLVDNITERKVSEQKVIQLNTELEERVIRRTEELKKSIEELESFSYSVSHDLRAPLRAIIGFASILEEEYGTKLDEEAMRIIAVIRDSTLKMGNLIDDLLAFSRMGKQGITIVPFNINAMVQEIAHSLEQQMSPHNKISWNIQTLHRVNADMNTIRQVWVNLISNAIKYSGKRKKPRIEIGSYAEKDQIIFFIKDNGVGFNEEYKHKLFKVFQRLHDADEFEGTGVGLALVEKIIARHDGKIWAEGKEDEGAGFYFSLPN